jgi:Cyclin
MHEFLSNAVTLLWLGKAQNDKQFARYIRDVMRPINPRITLSVVYCSLYYIHRLSHLCQTKKAPRSEYRIVVAALILGDIAINDHPYSVKSWSKLSGFSQRNIVAMRREFLQILDYNLVIRHEAYTQWVVTLTRILEAANCSENKLPPLRMSESRSHEVLYPSPVSADREMSHWHLPGPPSAHIL